MTCHRLASKHSGTNWAPAWEHRAIRIRSWVRALQAPFQRVTRMNFLTNLIGLG